LFKLVNSATSATPAATFGAAPLATPSFGAANAATPSFGASNNASNSFGFSTPANQATAASFGGSCASSSFAASQPTAPSSSFGFGSQAPSTTGSFSAPTTSTSSGMASNQFFSSSNPSHTTTGMPYPKETKFSDLPADIQKAIENLETTIRGYEATSFHITERRYEAVDISTSRIQELEGKLQVFDFAIQQNQARMIAAKRNLGKYWKYGENVARHVTSLKAVAGHSVPPAVDAIDNLILASDQMFIESIIHDFEQKAGELSTLASNVNVLVMNIQSQSSFSIQSVKNTIKAHSETLLALAEKLASFHDEIETLRSSYRQFCLLYRNDSRDPFASKYVAPASSDMSGTKLTSVIAPMLNTLLGQSSQPSSPFGFSNPTTKAPPVSFPSANSFLKT